MSCRSVDMSVSLPRYSHYYNCTEYCGNEVFSPTCSHDQVIVMTHATYGRMKLGKCIKRDLGFIGCQTDILAVLDSKCSNKRTCTVDINDDLNFNDRIPNPCSSEMFRHLEANYTCQSGKFQNVCTLIVALCDDIGLSVMIFTGTTHDRDFL